jgi:hypothetical protein
MAASRAPAAAAAIIKVSGKVEEVLSWIMVYGHKKSPYL